MSKYATGKYAKAISDRSGMEFPYREMLREWNGSLVHVSEYEAKQPQLEPKPHGADGIALRNDEGEIIFNKPLLIPFLYFAQFSKGSPFSSVLWLRSKIVWYASHG